jgi:polysaccharide export outer membrane protein
MYAGVQSTGAPGSPKPETDIAARADIHAITPESVARLNDALDAARQQAAAQRKVQAPAPDADAHYEYLVAPQDVLNVTVWSHPELNNPAGQLSTELAGRTVGADGTFFYPYAGKVKAAGLTVAAIRKNLTARLARYLAEPQVDVSVLQYRGRRAFAIGEFQKPGPQAITDVPLRVTDLIAKSGGLAPKAEERDAVLTHDGVARRIDLYALYHDGDTSQNVLLQDGDTLNVREQRYNKVFVLGEVAKPQSLPLPYGTFTLAEALSDAGGLNPVTANGSQIYVLRAGTNGKPQIWHLNGKSPDALILADRFDLQARDVVFVDAAAVTRWSRVLDQLLPFFGGVANVNTSLK